MTHRPTDPSGATGKMRLGIGALMAVVLVAACGGTDPQPAAEWGARLAASPRLSSSPSNQVACTTCHAVTRDDERILPGHSLVGAFDRPSFWGGYEPDLRGAVDACLLFFMKGQRLDPRADDARALFDYLATLGGRGERGALPHTVVTKPGGALPPGDPVRGALVHRLACESCHGAAGSGDGRLMDDAPVLPDQAVAEARELFPDDPPAAVFAEKVRHGQFFSVGGTMPLFSLEALPDEDLAALLAFYGIE
ncbi:MAG TPA: c-type cytochrome [Vulgatibacter sp.]